MSTDASTVVEPTEPHAGTMFLLHGLGSSGDDMRQVVPLLQRPDLRFILPDAPPRDVTLNQGFRMRAWYDILGFERSVEREPEADILESAEQIQKLLDEEVERGTAAEKIVLGGFSQGAAMTLHVGLTTPLRLAGIVVLSGYLVRDGAMVSDVEGGSVQSPAFCAHGSEDPQVSVDWGRAAAERLKQDLRQVEWRTYPMGHTLHAEEIVDLRAWLQVVLPSEV